MRNLVDHIEESVRTRRLFRRGESILIAVSGGLDSMVLLRLLHQFSAKYDWRLTVAHFNHQLRGRSSNADERLVRKIAAVLKLPVVVESADVKQFADKHGLSLEMGSRQLRHEFFARTAKQRKISTVALAHHADDQVELFFLRVLRSAGGDGLAGMKWVGVSPVDPGVKLVRPLLGVDKAALATFARQQRVGFREDASNRSVEFQRNRIRHELIPLLRKDYQPALSQTTLRLMEIVGEETAFVTQSARAWLTSRLRPLKRGKGDMGKGGTRLGSTFDFRFSTLNFPDLPVAIQRRVLQLQLLGLGVIADFDLIERLRGAVDEAAAVNPQLCVVRDATGRIHAKKVEATGFIDRQLTLDLTKLKGTLTFDRLEIQWQIESQHGFRATTAKVGCEYFDATKVGSLIVLRHWQPGDRFQPIGMASPVKLQDLFTNRKIPRGERRRLCVAASEGGALFWVEGLRIAELFKLDKQTRHRLNWNWRRF